MCHLLAGVLSRVNIQVLTDYTFLRIKLIYSWSLRRFCSDSQQILLLSLLIGTDLVAPVAIQAVSF